MAKQAKYHPVPCPNHGDALFRFGAIPLGTALHDDSLDS